MTTDKIDVLAVLREHRRTCRIQGCEWCIELDACIDAVAELIAERDALREELRLRQRLQKLPASDSAAVAELIEAAREELEVGFNAAPTPTRRRLSAAIAKATGASA